MGECNGCGACCDPVAMPQTKWEILALPGLDPLTRQWVLNALTPMGAREAMTLEPHIRRVSFGLDPVTNEPSPVFFFRCAWFDRESRTCTRYDERPSACRDYPWGGVRPEVVGGVNLAPWCGYRPDQGLPVVIRPRDPDQRRAAVEADTAAIVAATGVSMEARRGSAVTR